MAKWTLNMLDYYKLLVLCWCLSSCQAYTPSGYEGCYSFSRQSLTVVISSSIYNNGDDCKDACSNAGYEYAGTRAMNCWCGHNIGTDKNDGSCNWGCPDSNGEICGGLYGISIYDADYTINLVAAIVIPIVVVIVIVIVVVVIIIWRKRKARKEEESYVHTTGTLHAERSYDARKQKVSSVSNKGFSDYRSPESHTGMHADMSLSPEYDDHAYGKKKRTWSQYDEDDYETGSNFTPIPMDDQDYSSYPKSSYHDTAI